MPHTTSAPRGGVRRWRPAIACSLSLLPVACQLGGGGARDEVIVYSTLRPQNLDIYLFERRGEPPRRLTDDAALDYNAVFSPDGRWVVFTSERLGNTDLYALDLQGAAQPTRLTRHAGADDAATFAPDGRRLAFVSTRDGDADIFVMEFAPGDASVEQRATNLTRRPGGDFNPAFSPDGRQIAYSRQDELWGGDAIGAEAPVLASYGVRLYVMNTDGSASRCLSAPGPGLQMGPMQFGRVCGSPAWSADASTVFYYSQGAAGLEIRRVGRDGSADARVASMGISPAVGVGGRVVFSQPQPRPRLDAFDLLKTGRIVSVAADGSDLRVECDGARSYFAPDVDRAGRVVCHGPGPVVDLPLIAGDVDGHAFAPPGARYHASLPDRDLAVVGVRGYFPALLPDGRVVSSPLHLGAGGVPLTASELDGSGRRPLFARDGQIAWGAAVARGADMLTFAVGPPFAPGEAGVDIWRARLDGADPVNLTGTVAGNDALPHTCADGSRIVFRSGGDGGGKVEVMDLRAGTRRRLTGVEAMETQPAISADGAWVVFPSNRAVGWKLWIQRVDGSGGRFLEPDRLDVPDVSMHPRFSPDGGWIVFTSDRAWFNDEWPLTWYPQPYGELYAIRVEGGDAFRLTHNKWEDGPCDWAAVPDRTAASSDH